MLAIFQQHGANNFHSHTIYDHNMTMDKNQTLIFSKVPPLTEESIKILDIDLRTFPISQSLAFFIFFKLQWIVWILQVPISKRAGSSLRHLFSSKNFKNNKLRLEPSKSTCNKSLGLYIILLTPVSNFSKMLSDFAPQRNWEVRY